MRRLVLWTVLFACFVLFFFAKSELKQRQQREAVIEEAKNVVVPQSKEKPGRDTLVALQRKPEIASEVNWDVPFTPQAPTANWDALHEEACEEASASMVLTYFAEETYRSPEDADKDIQKLVKINEEDLGFGVDQTAQQVAATLAHQNRKLRISVVSNPSEESLKSALSQGFLIIVPAAGRQLGNPYYRRPGPLYHMLVLRGYTKDGYAITNDPGTKRGKEYVYKWPVLLNAVHDWNGGDVERGAKVVIVVGQYVISASEVER